MKHYNKWIATAMLALCFFSTTYTLANNYAQKVNTLIGTKGVGLTSG